MKHPIGQKKAQITLIVIFCIIVVVIVVLLLLTKKAAKPSDKVGADDTSSLKNIFHELETGVLKEHVNSCIFKLASDGVEKIGANGGLIYDFDGGTIPFKPRQLGVDYLNFTSAMNRPYFVAYSLMENSFCPEISYEVPDYPVKGKAFSALSGIYASEDQCMYNHFSAEYDGIFGQSNLSKLCYAAKESGCEGFAKGDVVGFTIQKQIEDYITTRLPLCVNFSFFEERVLADISQDGNISVDVNIRDSDMLVLVKYPIRVSFEDSEPVTRLIDYQSSLNVRLGALYNFIYDVFSRDSKSPGYSISNAYINSAYMKQGFELKRINDACKGCPLPYHNDDLIEAIDKNSLVNGKPLLFRSAVQDRRPAIDLIDDVNADLNVASQNIDILISAFDPDDSALEYIFFVETGMEGWREHEDPIQSRLDLEHRLKFGLTTPDWGARTAGVLVVDDSGLFDYQTFLINVSDSVIDAQRGVWSVQIDPCIITCTTTALLPYEECLADWCWAASGPCISSCQGNFLLDDPRYPDCSFCLKDVIYADDPEIYPLSSCVGLAKDACLAAMPDCFWLNEPGYGVSGYDESCHGQDYLSDAPADSFLILT